MSLKVITNEKYEKIPVLLTKNQVKKLLNVSETTLWRLRKNGLIKEIKIGSKILFDEQEIIKFLNRIQLIND